jgi:hypothetical protein
MAEDKIIEMMTAAGVTPKVTVKGTVPGIKQNLSVKLLFGDDDSDDEYDDEPNLAGVHNSNSGHHPGQAHSNHHAGSQFASDPNVHHARNRHAGNQQPHPYNVNSGFRANYSRTNGNNMGFGNQASANFNANSTNFNVNDGNFNANHGFNGSHVDAGFDGNGNDFNGASFIPKRKVAFADDEANAEPFCSPVQNQTNPMPMPNQQMDGNNKKFKKNPEDNTTIPPELEQQFMEWVMKSFMNRNQNQQE